jgi:hypothetical protein
VAIVCVALASGAYIWREQRLAAAAQAAREAEESRLRAELREIILKDEGYVEMVMDASPNSDFEEFFRDCDFTILERDKLIVAVRELPAGLPNPFRDLLISHLKATNDLVRSKKSLMRLVLQLRTLQANTRENFHALMAEAPEISPEASINWAYKRLVEQNKSVVNEIFASAKEFLTLYGQLTDEEAVVAAKAGDLGITSSVSLKKFHDANTAMVTQLVNGGR